MWNESLSVDVKLRDWLNIWDSLKDNFSFDLSNASDDVKNAIDMILSNDNTHDIIDQIEFVISSVIQILSESYWYDNEIEVKKITFKLGNKEKSIKVWEWNLFSDFIDKFFKKKKKKHKKWEK